MKTATPYGIWHMQYCSSPTKWIKTAHSLLAFSDKDAQTRARAQFARTGFHSMRLLAVKRGVDPNEGA